MTKKKKAPERSTPPKTDQVRPLRRESAANENAPLATETAATPRTYLPESFVVLLLCLTPVALLPIYHGLAVRQATQANDFEKAKSASELARIWFILSVCFGVTANIVILGVYLISQKD